MTPISEVTQWPPMDDAFAITRPISHSGDTTNLPLAPESWQYDLLTRAQLDGQNAVNDVNRALENNLTYLAFCKRYQTHLKSQPLPTPFLVAVYAGFYSLRAKYSDYDYPHLIPWTGKIVTAIHEGNYTATEIAIASIIAKVSRDKYMKRL